MQTKQNLTVEKNDPHLCIAGTEHLWSVCLKTRDNLGVSTEVLAENVVHEDAVIFAAAPEMLEALREMLSMFGDHEQYDEDSAQVISQTRQVIAKAEGREA
jgi:fructose-specific phosphotransferase system component IIB